jgi:hypothetical protein
MIEKVSEKVSIVSSYNQEKDSFAIYKMGWRKREYFIKKIAYHHKVREGRDLFHIFHVTDNNLDFRIRFNTENLEWILEEVSDGSAN